MVRRLLFVLLVLVAIVVVVRVALDPVAAAATRRALGRLEGVRGAFDGVHVTLLPPSYTITRLSLDRDQEGRRSPLFFAETARVSLDGSRLLRGRLVARARLVEPKFTIVVGGPAAPKAGAKRPARPPDLSAQLRELTPVRIDRVEILRGELLFRDAGEPRHPELWVHRLELAAENLATRPRLAGARPTTVTARGVLGRSGELELFASADPFASPLELAGRLRVVGLRAAELYAFVAPKTKLQTPEGTVDVFAEFSVENGRIEGGVKPVLKNVEVRAAEPGAWPKLKAWFADEAVELASDRAPGRHAIATVVPIRGTFSQPDVQLWPAILGVARNAFVEGVSAGFADVPAPVAPTPQGPLEQTRRALDADRGPPRAQPAVRGKP
jgi:hypothetical protein